MLRSLRFLIFFILLFLLGASYGQNKLKFNFKNAPSEAGTQTLTTQSTQQATLNQTNSTQSERTDMHLTEPDQNQKQTDSYSPVEISPDNSDAQTQYQNTNTQFQQTQEQNTNTQTQQTEQQNEQTEQQNEQTEQIKQNEQNEQTEQQIEQTEQIKQNEQTEQIKQIEQTEQQIEQTEQQIEQTEQIQQNEQNEQTEQIKQNEQTEQIKQIEQTEQVQPNEQTEQRNTNTQTQQTQEQNEEARQSLNEFSDTSTAQMNKTRQFLFFGSHRKLPERAPLEKREKIPDSLTLLIPVNLEKISETAIPLLNLLQSISMNLPVKTGSFQQILLMEYSHPSNVAHQMSHQILSTMMQRLPSNIKVETVSNLIAEIQGTPLDFRNAVQPEVIPASLADAINQLADWNLIQAEFTIFLSPFVQFESGFFDELFQNLKEKNPGANAAIPLILKPDGRIYSTGIDFEVGGLSWSLSKTAVPFHSLKGTSQRDRRVSEKKWTLSASGISFIIRSHILDQIKVDPQFTDNLLWVDFFLRNSQEIPIVHETRAYFFGHDSFSTDNLQNFHEAWGEPILQEIESHYEVKGLTLEWNMECGIGPVLGFTTEAMSIVHSVVNRVAVKISTSNFDSCQQELLSIGIPDHEVERLRRLSLLETGSSASKVLVVHRDPGRYSYFVPSWDRPLFVFGRSMFETDRIPEHWVNPANELVDKIWVPSKFNVETFKRSGVREDKLEVFPESFNEYVYDPEAAEPLVLEKGAFNFLSLMKWEERKGWKTLLAAYFAAFRANEDVVLWIRSSLMEDDIRALQEWVVEQQEKLKVEALPRIQILDSPISFHALPNLYAAADCVVLASHGEGWGLPLIEGMAMGLPVIGTNWSGNTEFMNKNNSFLIQVEEMVEAKLEPGHLWAQPSTTSLAKHMRTVFDEKARARAIGNAAKTFVHTHFSQRAVGDLLVQKLRNLEESAAEIIEKRKEEEEQKSKKAALRSGRRNIKIV